MFISTMRNKNKQTPEKNLKIGTPEIITVTVLKMKSLFYAAVRLKDADRTANGVGPDQTAPSRGGGRVVRFPVPGRPTLWIRVGQGPTALAVGVGGSCLDIFTLIYPFFPLSPSLADSPI